jgi:formamidopyrimidine-DNA glycosylase
VLDERLNLAPDELAGAVIGGISRRGKYIVIDLGTRGDLVVHLRMSGRLRQNRSSDEARYTRMILHVHSGEEVYFVNPRRLGTAVFYPDGFDKPLGVEPTGAAFTADVLAELTTASRTPIKQLLLDQGRIAGIGNIYAAESLWRAGIDPRRAANTLDDRR